MFIVMRGGCNAADQLASFDPCLGENVDLAVGLGPVGRNHATFEPGPFLGENGVFLGENDLFLGESGFFLGENDLFFYARMPISWARMPHSCAKMVHSWARMSFFSVRELASVGRE